jgi:molybdenum storage protein
MVETIDATLRELGLRLAAGSLSDSQRATDATPDFAILPWVNVVKIGGQSILDRGRSVVVPLIDEIVEILKSKRHKMILGTGAGTRARHVYSLAIDLGLPVGVLTVLGTAVAGRMRRCCTIFSPSTVLPLLSPKALPHYRTTSWNGVQ